MDRVTGPTRLRSLGVLPTTILPYSLAGNGTADDVQGHFISFEGGEGAGKSTQINRLRSFLETRGKKVLVTREPGGSPGAEKIRHMLLSGEARDLGPRGEAMLFAAARADHVDTTIKPALEAGTWVLCDRYADSTRVYQGEAGVDRNYLKLLETAAVAGVRPDLTILVDIPAEIGLMRVMERSRDDASGGPDRFEGDALRVHERRRQLFLELAREEAYRFAVVDGTSPPDAVEADIQKAVLAAFGSELEGVRAAPHADPQDA